jgi:carbonic anhydrase
VSSNFVQFYFNALSKVPVDGEVLCLVAHLMHESEEGKLAAIGVLLNEGRASSP